jgi:hypothetical protein
MPATICGITASRPAPLWEPTWDTTPAGADHAGYGGRVDQGGHRLGVELRLGRGQVDEVDGVAQDRRGAQLGVPVPEAAHVVGARRL